MHLSREMRASNLRTVDALPSLPKLSKNTIDRSHLLHNARLSRKPTLFLIARYSSAGQNTPPYDNNTSIPANQLQRSPPSSDDVFLPRSLIMDKEIITRTSGKRLGYVNQLYVDPARLEVISVYLRQGMTSIGASNTDHILISSLRQIGDVVLVHDESALLDPPADETFGYVKLVGTEVQTEDGTPLGKVRDFVFNPDNGQIVSVRYDALGIPSIPQSLLSCYTLNWRDIVAVGPTKTIVRRGADRRAVKENDGWISEYVNTLVNALAGTDEENAMQLPGGAESYRNDPAYAAWYQRHAMEYEQYYGQTLPKPILAEEVLQQQQQQRRRQQPTEQVRRRRPPPEQQQQQQQRRPRALPPPQSVPFNQAVQQGVPTRERTRQYAGGDDRYQGQPQPSQPPPRMRAPPAQRSENAGARGSQQQQIPRNTMRGDRGPPPGSRSPPLPQMNTNTMPAPSQQQQQTSFKAPIEPDAVISNSSAPFGQQRQEAEYTSPPPQQQQQQSAPERKQPQPETPPMS